MGDLNTQVAEAPSTSATPDYAALAQQFGGVIAPSVPSDNAPVDHPSSTSGAVALAQGANYADLVKRFGGSISSPSTPQEVPAEESNLHKAVLGPNTMLGAPTPEPWKQEASGVGDILHGDIAQGAGKIWHAEQPHVIPGSPMEKLIQKFNPDFHGAGGGPQQVNALSLPPVDVAQFVDKDKHPVAKALTEAAQSFVSPQNVAVMLGTGGLGMIDSPSSLAVANRLISAGFSAATAANAYKELKSFKEAYDKGDANEALYQLTHAVVSGTMSALALQHTATGKAPTPATALGEKADELANKSVNAVVEPIKNAVQDVAISAGNARESLGTLAGKVVGKETPEQGPINAAKEFKKAIPPTATTPYEEHDYETARNYLEQHHENIQPIRGVEDTRDAADNSIKGIENRVSDLIKIVPDEPISTDVLSDVRQALGKSPRGEDFVNSGLKELEGLNLEKPTLSEADTIRRQLNDENRGILKKNNYDLAAARASDPGFAAREIASESLRNGIYDQLENYGINGVRDMRLDEGSLIKIRNAAQHQIFKGEKVVRGTGKAGPVREIAKNTTKMAATAAGAAVGGPAGAVIGATAGESLGKYITPGDLTRDQLLENSFNRKVATGTPTEPTVNLRQPPAQETHVGTQGELLNNPSTLFDVGQTPAPSGGPLAKVEGRAYRSANPIEAGPAFTSPDVRLQPNEPASSLPAVERRAILRGQLRSIIEDPVSTAVEKNNAREKLRLVERGSTRLGVPLALAGTAALGTAAAALKKDDDQKLTPDQEAEWAQPSASKDIPTLLDEAAERHGVPPALLHAQAQQESHLNPDAISRAGAQGVLQLMPKTAEELGVEDATDPVQNVEAGARYLKQLHDRFKRYDLALAAYDAGPTKVQKAIEEHGSNWLEHMPHETQTYVHKILREAAK